MAAFRFTERLAGKMYLLGDPLVERDVSLDIDAHLRKLTTRIAQVTGRIRADGLAANAPLQGTLGLHALHDRRVPYDLAFTDDQGRSLRLRGEKDLSWLAPVETLVVMHFTIGTSEAHAWREIARGTLRTTNTASALVRSLRFAPI